MTSACKYPARTSLSLDGPACLPPHLYLVLLLDGQLSRFSSFPWLGFYRRNGISRVPSEENRVPPSASVLFLKHLTPRAEQRNFSCPLPHHGFFSQGDVLVLQLNTLVSKQRDQGQRLGDEGAAAGVPVLGPSFLQSLGVVPNSRGRPFSHTPAVAAARNPGALGGHPAPSTPVTGALPEKKAGQGPGGRHEAAGREPGVPRPRALSGGSEVECSPLRNLSASQQHSGSATHCSWRKPANFLFLCCHRPSPFALGKRPSEHSSRGRGRPSLQLGRAQENFQPPAMAPPCDPPPLGHSGLGTALAPQGSMCRAEGRGPWLSGRVQAIESGDIAAAFWG